MAADVADAGLKQLVETMAREGFGQRLTTCHLDISDQRACAASTTNGRTAPANGPTFLMTLWLEVSATRR